VCSSDLLRVGGAGEVDLVNETFNYTARPTIVETSKGQGGRGLEDLGGLTVPVKLSGTFAQPKYKIDVAGMAREQAKGQINKQIDAHKDEIRDQINKGLGKLFGGGKKPAPATEPAPAPAEEPKKEESAPATP
jgi:AsmA protein